MICDLDIDEVPEQGGGFCIFPRSHHELFSRDSAFADMAHASFNYPDEERAIAQGAPPEQVPFVGKCLHSLTVQGCLKDPKRLVDRVSLNSVPNQVIHDSSRASLRLTTKRKSALLATLRRCRLLGARGTSS